MAAISGERRADIWHRISYAECLAYDFLWWEKWALDRYYAQLAPCAFAGKEPTTYTVSLLDDGEEEVYV